MYTCLHSWRNNSLFQSIQSSEEPGKNVMGEVRKYLQKTAHKMKGRTSLLTSTKYITWRISTELSYLALLPKGWFFSSGWKRGLLKQLLKKAQTTGIAEQLPYRQTIASKTQLQELWQTWEKICTALKCQDLWQMAGILAGMMSPPVPSAQHSFLHSPPEHCCYRKHRTIF